MKQWYLKTTIVVNYCCVKTYFWFIVKLLNSSESHICNLKLSRKLSRRVVNSIDAYNKILWWVMTNNITISWTKQHYIRFSFVRIFYISSSRNLVNAISTLNAISKSSRTHKKYTVLAFQISIFKPWRIYSAEPDNEDSYFDQLVLKYKQIKIHK